MSDASIAAIGRRLAQALIRRAYERDPQSAKDVLLYHTELCAEYRAEAQAASEPQPETPT